MPASLRLRGGVALTGIAALGGVEAGRPRAFDLLGRRYRSPPPPPPPLPDAPPGLLGYHAGLKLPIPPRRGGRVPRSRRGGARRPAHRSGRRGGRRRGGRPGRGAGGVPSPVPRSAAPGPFLPA